MTIEDVIARVIDPLAWDGARPSGYVQAAAKMRAARIVDALAAAGYAIVPPPEGTVS